MKALVDAFNQEKALVGAFSVIVQPVVELRCPSPPSASRPPRCSQASARWTALSARSGNKNMFTDVWHPIHGRQDGGAAGAGEY